jgi:hypothetical protein
VKGGRGSCLAKGSVVSRGMLESGAGKRAGGRLRALSIGERANEFFAKSNTLGEWSTGVKLG